MSHLTVEQAYTAMFLFLEGYYDRTGSDDVGGLLGSMSLLRDGRPADAAVTADWQKAVQYALSGGHTPSLALKPK